ncbi:MAG TPA: hypothetical protein VMT03_09775 [Polyangia bacterium]|nr:hypothetical protein [Polyangia bacterium]
MSISPDQDADRQVPADARPTSPRLNALVLSLLSFCLILFGVWLVSAGKRYRQEYSQVTAGWQVGATRVVELTLVRADKLSLACASDVSVAGLHCGFRRDFGAVAASPDDPLVLQPYNTTGGELLLGAGLWTSPDLKGTLPTARFTVVCNYHIEGLTSSTAVRFGFGAPFSRIGTTATMGRLTDCVLPR